MPAKKGCIARAFFVTLNPHSISALLADDNFPVDVFESGDYDNLPHDEIAKKLLAVWTTSKEGRTGAVVLCKGSDEEKYHGHMALYSPQNTTREHVNKILGGAYVTEQRGSKKDLKEYMLKEGAHADNDEKVYCSYGMENLEDARQNKSNASGFYEEMVELIKAGKSDREIIDHNPAYISQLSALSRLRDLYRPAPNYREVSVAYLFGATGTGKTRYVRDNPDMPPETIYCANGNHPFDGYAGQDVVFFDEFRSDYPLKDMLRYLDDYSTTLSARYHDKQASYSKVYLASNWPFEKQYEHEKTEDVPTYQAFMRRINIIYWFRGDDLINYRSDIEDWYAASKGNKTADKWFYAIDWARGIIPYFGVEQYLSRNKTSGIINQGRPMPISSALPPLLKDAGF